MRVYSSCGVMRPRLQSHIDEQAKRPVPNQCEPAITADFIKLPQLCKARFEHQVSNAANIYK